MEKIDLENRQIQLTMLLKLQQLQREALPSLQYKNIEDALRFWKWRKKTPRTLHEAVNDIRSLSADEIVSTPMFMASAISSLLTIGSCG